jgi:hypothetical protein
MSTSLVNADTLLAIDIGTVTTRAILFDVVEGRYRFIGAGVAPSTAGAPLSNVTAGVQAALDDLQGITGRTLLNLDRGLIIPSQSDGSGVDLCVTTVSAGPPLKVVAIGLLEDVSTESAQNLATTTYAQVIETLSLNDRRKTADRLDTILRARPNLVIVAGGTEGGASQSVINLLEAVGLACYLLPKDHRPEILFAGNSALAKVVQETLGHISSLHIAANVRPTLEVEQLTPAQPQLAQVYRQVRARQMRGIQEIDIWSAGRLMPTATAFGRTIRFISKEFAGTKKGVLGVDVGASATTVAAGFAGDLILSVYTRFGIGESLPKVVDAVDIDHVLRWIPYEIQPSVVREYAHNKALFPTLLPTTSEQLFLEQALATQAIQLACAHASKKFPLEAARSAPGLLPWFEPIIAAGSVLTRAPKIGQSLIMLLNALQPSGVTTIALDRNDLAAALGASAGVNPLLTIQSLDASNFMSLATVVAPVGMANYGTPVLRVRVTYGDGSESSVDVKFGALEVIPLARGQTVSLHLTPLHRFDVGMGGPGRSGSMKVTGGGLGVVIDARGRPLRLPADPGRRRELIKKWLWTMGA